MAEEILYDEQMVTDEGDPKDPLGLRKKLSATKEKPDPLGLRAKLKPAQAATPVTHEQALALPKIDYSRPVFQENVSESTAVPQMQNQALLAGAEKQTRAEKYENKVKESSEKIFNEILHNDKAYENLIRKQRLEEAGRKIELPTSDMPSQGALVQDVAQFVKQEPDQPITSQDLEDKKALAKRDEIQARKVLEEAARINPEKAKDIKLALYHVDRAAALEQDPDAINEFKKVQLKRGKMIMIL